MEISTDKKVRKFQKTILRHMFPDYNPIHHDVFVMLYNKVTEERYMKENMKERGLTS